MTKFLLHPKPLCKQSPSLGLALLLSSPAQRHLPGLPAAPKPSELSLNCFPTKQGMQTIP